MGWTIGFQFPAGTFHHHIRSGSGAHPVSYPMGTSGSLLRDKVAK